MQPRGDPCCGTPSLVYTRSLFHEAAPFSARQAATEALCRRMLWDWAGLHGWLLAAVHRPVRAIAAYDAGSALELVVTFGRHGVATSRFKEVACPKVCNSSCAG